MKDKAETVVARATAKSKEDEPKQKSAPGENKTEKKVDLKKEPKSKTEGKSPLLADIAWLKERVEETTVRVRERMLSRIDGVAAKMEALEKEGKGKRRGKKMSEKIEKLNIRPEKGRARDLGRISRVLDRMEKQSGADKK